MKILYLTSRFPFPINKGDKLRAYYQLKSLSEKNEVHLISLNDEGEIEIDNKIEDITNFCKVINISKFDILKNLANVTFSRIPFQVGYFYNRRIEDLIKAYIEQTKPDLIFCQLIRMAEYIRGVNDIPKVIDYIDVLSKGLERRIRTSGVLIRPFVSCEYKRVYKYEEEILNDFNQGIIITEQDRELLPVSNSAVKIIPNGIDTYFFESNDSVKDIDILFAGNMNYPPNVDAAIYLVEKILPILKNKIATLKIFLVGASPCKKVKKLESENVVVTGWVDDIREYYDRAKVFIAPLQIGTGLQNKLLEAMLMGIPCITSSLAQKGIKAHQNRELLIAESPEEYAELFLKIFNDTELYLQISTQARQFVIDNYAWQNIGILLDQLLINTVQSFKNK